jgi:hypothetical protein
MLSWPPFAACAIAQLKFVAPQFLARRTSASWPPSAAPAMILSHFLGDTAQDSRNHCSNEVWPNFASFERVRDERGPTERTAFQARQTNRITGRYSPAKVRMSFSVSGWFIRGMDVRRRFKNGAPRTRAAEPSKKGSWSLPTLVPRRAAREGRFATLRCGRATARDLWSRSFHVADSVPFFARHGLLAKLGRRVC